MIHTVKGFSVVNEAEADVFLEFSCFFYDPVDIGNLISGSFAFFAEYVIWSKTFSKMCMYVCMYVCVFVFYSFQDITNLKCVIHFVSF